MTTDQGGAVSLLAGLVKDLSKEVRDMNAELRANGRDLQSITSKLNEHDAKMAAIEKRAEEIERVHGAQQAARDARSGVWLGIEARVWKLLGAVGGIGGLVGGFLWISEKVR